MQIDTHLVRAYDNGLATGKTHTSSAYQTEDASFFSSQIERSASPVSSPSAANSPNLLVEASNQLSKSANGMSKGLRALSTGGRERDRAEYSTHLSNNLLLTQVLVKSVGKTAQLVEKISNLQ